MYREESDSYHRKLLQIMLLPKKAKQKDKGYKLFNTRFFIWLLKVIFFFFKLKDTLSARWSFENHNL